MGDASHVPFNQMKCEPVKTENDSVGVAGLSEHLYKLSLDVIKIGRSKREFDESIQKRGVLDPQIREVCWAAVLKEPGYWRGTSWFVKRPFEVPVSVGTKLWRPLDRQGQPMVLTFEPTSRNEHVIHARQDGDMWIAWAQGIGMTVFSETCPEGWVAFEVIRFSNNGRAAFAKPILGSPESLRAAYRRTCAKGKHLVDRKVGYCRGCEALAREEAQDREAAAKEGLMYKPLLDRFICRTCAPKAPIGKGTCVSCGETYV